MTSFTSVVPDVYNTQRGWLVVMVVLAFNLVEGMSHIFMENGTVVVLIQKKQIGSQKIRVSRFDQLLCHQTLKFPLLHSFMPSLNKPKY